MSDMEEADHVGAALRAMIRAHRIPPDDAYFWTRYVCDLSRQWAAYKDTMNTTTKLTTGLLLLLASAASAQTGPCPAVSATQTTVVAQGSPTLLCFTPSSEHAAVDPVTSAARLTRYDALWFIDGVDVTTASPVQTASLGKPAPNAQGVIWATLPAYPIGARYRLSVLGVNSFGSSLRSAAVSNPFGTPSSAAPTAPANPVIP